MGMLAVSCSDNLRDSVDSNVTPASQEQREEELINSPDMMDANEVPAQEEEREVDEVSIYE